MNRILLILVSLFALVLTPACIGPGGGAGSPFVGYATLSGNGDARTDGNVFLALGDLQGDAGLFLKGSGFPLTFPLNTKENEWVAVNREAEITVRGHLGTDPLPGWTAPLFRPGELAVLSERLGYPITIYQVPP